MVTDLLADPIDLGEGRSIRPPADWSVTGFAIEDPHRVGPPKKFVMVPPGKHDVIISWSTQTWLVGKASADYFNSLLSRQRVLSIKEIEPLYPILVRVPMANVVDARVISHHGAGLVLAVSYVDAENGKAGYLLYAPTSEIPGEIQILSFEGMENDYAAHVTSAMASLESFKDEYLLSR